MVRSPDKGGLLISIEQAARIAHETNRAYCATINDHSLSPWESAPEWQRASAIAGVAFHLEKLSRGEIPKPWQSHEAWLERKRREGWSYGPVKDEANKKHPCFLPYTLLPREQRTKDHLFGAIVRELFESEALVLPAPAASGLDNPPSPAGS